MERLTTRHCGVAVIKDKTKLKEAMEKLATYEDAEEQKSQCKPGDRIWCIEGSDGDEVGGYLFMSTCGEYVIATPSYVLCDNFNAQLLEMSEESLEFDGVEVRIFEKEAVYTTKEEAIARMEKENG